MNVLKITLRVNNLKIAIVTVAGISSRFNKDVSKKDKILKCIYHENNVKYSLIYQMTDKLKTYDKIIIVGGYKFTDLKEYVESNIDKSLKEKISFVYNEHYDDLSSGYSLYLGIKETLAYDNVSEVIFVEGDLDIDFESFKKVIDSSNDVLTFNHEPIYSNKAVVLYQNDKNEYKYLFNSDHGNLTINEPFKAIFNSGQTWKFQNIELLKIANNNFEKYLIEDTNLGIIQKYFDLIENKDDIELIGLKHWVNCNTREDYKLIRDYWEK